MQYKNTLEAVYIHLDEIQQLIAGFGAESGVRSIDVDLTLDKLRDVYDLMLELKMESVSGKDIEPVEERPKISKAPGASVFEISKEPEIELSVEQEIIEPPKEPEVVVEKTLQKPELERSKEETRAEIHSRVKPKNESKFLGESFSSQKPTINEELSQNKSSTDLSARMKTKPISSLTAAIGLNEKFELIHNLFNGDNAKYEHTMDVLNMAANFNEAFDYLNQSFSWDMNAPLVQRVLELVRRKLIVRKNEQ